MLIYWSTACIVQMISGCPPWKCSILVYPQNPLLSCTRERRVFSFIHHCLIDDLSIGIWVRFMLKIVWTRHITQEWNYSLLSWIGKLSNQFKEKQKLSGRQTLHVLKFTTLTQQIHARLTRNRKLWGNASILGMEEGRISPVKLTSMHLKKRHYLTCKTSLVF